MSKRKKERILLIRRMIFIIFAICWMMVIFHFSSKNADESTKDSNAAGMLVGRIVYSDFNVWPGKEQQVFAERWDYPIRKTAHMTEYAILGFLFVASVRSEKQRYKFSIFTAYAIAVLYAVSDEIHQFFVPGRACMLKDIGFDALGAAVGVTIGSALFIWWDKRLASTQD